MPAYIELHSHSYFSLLDGASSPEALVMCAAGLGMKALALTDHDAVYGAVRFERAARERGLHPVHGAELTLAGGHHLTLLVENERGWHNLCYLISRARHNAPKGSAMLPLEALIDHTAGLIALSGCRRGAIPSALLAGDWTGAHQFAALYYELFRRGRFYIELQHHYLPDDTALVYKLVTLARRVGVPYVATNNVHYTMPDAQPLQVSSRSYPRYQRWARFTLTCAISCRSDLIPSKNMINWSLKNTTGSMDGRPFPLT
jgi:error-prone DNA polymerase